MLEQIASTAYLTTKSHADSVEVFGGNHGSRDELIAIRHCAKRGDAEDYALVLAALGLRSSISYATDHAVVSVAAHDAGQASRELAAYDRENKAALSPSSQLRRSWFPSEAALTYCSTLLFFFAATSHHLFSLDWFERGSAHTRLILQGEWWRVITALCLHGDSVHLLGNLVFGALFLVLFAQVTGAGVAALSMVLAGAFGNALNALIQPQVHTSVGASTAIFGCLGALVVLRQARGRGHAISTLRNWAPLGGGFALLAFLGFSGENTDVLAHLLGFGSGLAIGVLLAGLRREELFGDPRLQWGTTAAAFFIIVTAWIVAAITSW